MTTPLDAHVLSVLIAEFRKQKTQGDRVLAQLPSDEALNLLLDPESNSISVLVRHMAGNMRSRWTDFLTSDGEKPTRKRDDEFNQEITLTREQAAAEWEGGWTVLLQAVDSLGPADLERIVSIRGENMTVFEAMSRALAHAAQHVGQMTMLAKHCCGARWRTLSIPRAPRARPQSSTSGH